MAKSLPKNPPRALGIFFGAACAILILGLASGFYLRSVIRKERAARYAAAQSVVRQDYAVTIPEGWRREQIALQLEEQGICTAASFIQASATKEGYLFPDTYRFFKDTPAPEVVQRMTTTFTKRTEGLNPTRDQIILASIVERESGGGNDRELIAGVYANRMAIGMALQADPTIQYALENTGALKKKVTDYWQPILRSDYDRNLAPYSTYTVAGLPPTPIANPGLASIKAAINPEKHAYYYFLHTKDGTILPSKTLAEHERKQR
jgi:UPF0755 protein